MLEAPDVIFKAPNPRDHVIAGTDPEKGRRHWPGLKEWFGAPPATWSQYVDGTKSNSAVTLTFTCFDTSFPSEQPTQQPTQPTHQPTEQPTEQPTLVPTELCTSVRLTIDGSIADEKYSGIYQKQNALINERDNWAYPAIPGVSLYFSTELDLCSDECQEYRGDGVCDGDCTD